MHAEIIAIGDEITSGQLLDTNTQWLSRKLTAMGIRVLYHTAVGDDLQACADVFRRAIARGDVVIATGGLGPTADDLTREAIARAVGRPLVHNAEALEHILALFARLRRKMPERNACQAMFPEGADVVHNPHGTAPGIDIEVPRELGTPCRLIALPGVPAELEEMWADSVADRLAGLDSGRVIRHRKIKCFGAGESQIEAMLPDLIRRGRQPTVGINASRGTIILRITAEGATEEACQAAIEPTIATIHDHLGRLVYGEGDDELQDAVVRLLRERNQTLATVEWGTAGMLAEWLAAVPGVGDSYRGGLVMTGETAPEGVFGEGWLGQSAAVPQEAEESVCQERLVRAMADACRRRFDSGYALAVGRLPDSNPKPGHPGEVWFALAGPDGATAKKHPFTGHPALRKIFCARRALNFVRLALLPV